MEIQGKFIQILPETRGTSARGEWVRGAFLIETEGDFPRKVMFTSFGEDRLAMIKTIPLGTNVTVTFSLESREYPENSGRYFTDARCIRVQPTVAVAGGMMPPQSTGYGVAAPAAPVAQVAAPQQPFAAAPETGLSNDDDLPF